MQSPLSERRFSDEELSRILDAATRAETSGATSGEKGYGYSLAEIREIAREAGIDPNEVDREAARLVAGADVSHHVPSEGMLSRSRRTLRIVHAERVIPRALSDAEMRMLAQQIEVVANRPGRSRVGEDWVEWREFNDRMYVGVVRGDGRTRIRVIADHGKEAVGGLVAIGVVAFVLEAASSGTGFGGPFVFMAIAAAWKYWGWRVSKTREELNELLDMLEESLPTR